MVKASQHPSTDYFSTTPKCCTPYTVYIPFFPSWCYQQTQHVLPLFSLRAESSGGEASLREGADEPAEQIRGGNLSLQRDTKPCAGGAVQKTPGCSGEHPEWRREGEEQTPGRKCTSITHAL